MQIENRKNNNHHYGDEQKRPVALFRFGHGRFHLIETGQVLNFFLFLFHFKAGFELCNFPLDLNSGNSVFQVYMKKKVFIGFFIFAQTMESVR
ncbi:hypothetical protein SDC9_48807 [bioreactor metagenome]|uniref:Uncharacterized protein n=1 Tax=bioreactor metagenome TaxID=1076179 RepID=A0A644WGD2_9ZZZZ